jgi:hypothetical protein
MFFPARRIFAALILVLSCTMILWSVWPFGQNSQSLSFKSEDVFLLTEQLEIFPDFPILETRVISLKWPNKIRVGEMQSIELAFTPENVSLEGQSMDNNPAQASNTFPEISDAYSVLVDGRLELTGVNFSPEGQVSQLLQYGEPLNYLWHVQVQQAGKYEGTVWLYLTVISKQTGQENRQVLSAQRIEFTAVNFFGLNEASTWLLGSLGLAIGIVLTFDRWVVFLWNTIWRKAGNQSVM